MNILLVNMMLEPVNGGGTVERTLQLARHMRKAGIDCSILTTDAGMTFHDLEVLREEGLRIIALRCIWDRFYLPLFSLSNMIKIVSKANVVHLMGHWTVINVLVYFFVRIIGKQYVVCPAGALSIYGRSTLLKSFFNFIIGKRIIKNAYGHIAISHNEISQFKYYGVDKDRVVNIPNGINPNDFNCSDVKGFRSKYGLNNFPFVLFFGRLHEEKGPDILLSAFGLINEIFSDVHLVFVGPDNGIMVKLRENVIEYSISDRVHFLGYLAGKDKSAAYHAATLVVIPSRFEAMSIVVLEAGICGMPVLLTDQCGFSEIERKKGGVVVPATVEGIRFGLEELLCDPSRLREMGRINKKYIQEHYTWDCAVQNYLKLFREITCSRPQKI